MQWRTVPVFLDRGWSGHQYRYLLQHRSMHDMQADADRG